MGKNQSFSFDNINDTYSEQDALGSGSKRASSPKRSALVIGLVGILLVLLLVAILFFATGIIVYFLHPNHGLVCDDDVTASNGDNVTWQLCLNFSSQMNECKY